MKRKLGKSGIEVSAMGMGCWAIGGPFWAGETPLGWGDVDDQESINTLHAAFEQGITFFDTADAYGTGHSETIIGRAFKEIRDRVIIATKFGNVIDERRKQLTGTAADADHIREACEASLHRLQTDYIDLYQFHINDYPASEAVAVRESLEALVAEGKIRAYGWSTDNPQNAAVFAEGQHCVAIQHQLNLFEDNPTLLTLCEENNQASINRGPLAMGLLSGKYQAGVRLADDDIRGRFSPEWLSYFEHGEANPALLQQLEAVREILLSDGRTLVQGAIAWLWGRSQTTIPIPGMRTVAQAVENAAAMGMGPLRPEQMLEVDSLLRR